MGVNQIDQVAFDLGCAWGGGVAWRWASEAGSKITRPDTTRSLVVMYSCQEAMREGTSYPPLQELR